MSMSHKPGRKSKTSDGRVLYLPGNPVDADQTFGLTIKKYREAAGFSQAALAEILDTSRNSIIKWEKNVFKPDFGTIRELCLRLKIPVSELYSLPETDGLTSNQRSLLTQFDALSETGQQMAIGIVSSMVTTEQNERVRYLREEYRLTPGFTSTAAAAGTGYGYSDTTSPDTFFFVRRNSSSAAADGIFLVHGDSMEPVYHSGNYVYLKYSQDALPGSDVICLTQDGPVIKRVAPDKTLFSVNPDYPFGNHSEDENIRMLGKVLGVVETEDIADEADEAVLREIFGKEIRKFNKSSDDV